MYPNFPRQVEIMDSQELVNNAIMHYLFPCWLPKYDKEPSLPMEYKNYTVLEVGTIEELVNIFKNLVSSKTNISYQDKQDIIAFTDIVDNWYYFLPDKIPHKEIKSLIVNILLTKQQYKILPSYLNTATDVLRFITAYSNGDESLATTTYFKKMNRKMRRLIMDCLANCGNTLIEDMARYKNEWIRIGEIIHPGEFKKSKYDRVREAFSAIRENNLPQSFMGKIESDIQNGNLTSTVISLMDRPGEFARKLDRLLCLAENERQTKIITNGFSAIASEVSIPVLLQVWQHFAHRNNDSSVRVFFSKGKIAKIWYTDDKRPNIPENICNVIQDSCKNGILKQLSSRSSMGKVYIDPKLSNYIIPFSQRSASTGKLCITRGSLLEMNPDTNYVRGFIHWTNTEDNERVDIDLSAITYDKDWEYLNLVDYTNLRAYGMIHSGDITNGGSVNGKGVAEFLDLDLNKLCKDEVAYVVFQVHCYSNDTFADLPHCSFGWMEREDDFSGEIFEPSTIKNRIGLTADGSIACPVIFDVEHRRFIWCDMIAPKDRHAPNNVKNNLTTTTALYYAMTHMNKPNLYNLISLNVEARGERVYEKEKADTIFAVDEGITPFDIDTLISDLM